MMELIVWMMMMGSALAYPECGRGGPSQNTSKSLILGGHEAKPGEWPWQVAIDWVDEVGEHWGCGGSILNKDWVLTAAHCIGVSHTVIVGQHNTRAKDPYEVSHAVKKAIKHPGYREGRWRELYNDIALLKMVKSISFDNPSVGPICLPKEIADHQGQFCHASGWGRTKKRPYGAEKLQTVCLKIWNDDYCKRKIPHTFDKNCKYCTGDKDLDVCQGDSGGPLSCIREDGRYEIAGITSYGDSCFSKIRGPGTFTRVPKFVHWIKDTMEDGTVDAPTTTPTPKGPVLPSETELPLRLIDIHGEEIDGKESWGLVQVFFDGKWGTLCDNLLENPVALKRTGDVLCRQLGNPNGGMVKRFRYRWGKNWLKSAELDLDNTPVWTSNIKCTGEEARLEECRSIPISGVCRDHREDVYLECH